MIDLILRILALFGWTVPGYSRDGPLCNNVEFAGVLFKPVTVPMMAKAQSVGLCLRRAKYKRQ